MYCENCRDRLDLARRNSMLLGRCQHCGEWHLCYDPEAPGIDQPDQFVPTYPNLKDETWADRPGSLMMSL